jgi:hypothetical protein
MLKRYGFATKPPTLPSGKTCILEMQIPDFAFSPKNLLPGSCVRRIDHRAWRCQAASLALGVMNLTVHDCFGWHVGDVHGGSGYFHRRLSAAHCGQPFRLLPAKPLKVLTSYLVANAGFFAIQQLVFPSFRPQEFPSHLRRYILWTGAETLGRMHSPLPSSLLANIIRGASLVAFLGHAQVVAGRDSLTQSESPARVQNP